MTTRGESSVDSRQQVLAYEEWAGGRLVHCRQRIQQPTEWGLEPGDRAEHTLIVHMGGRIRRLRTRIEGYGDLHHPALPGDVWCVPAGYSYAAHAWGHDVRFVELALDARGSSGELRTLAPRLAHRDDFLHRSVDLLLRASSSDTRHDRVIADRMREVITLHIEARYRDPDSGVSERPPALSHKAVRAVERYLATHLSERMRVSDLAAAAGLSVRQFRPRFAETFGTTPADYVLEMRVEEARRMLLETDADISTIAHAAGFASHSHLTETFRRRVGISPRSLRASVRGSAVPM